jgi:hypothetical protein
MYTVETLWDFSGYIPPISSSGTKLVQQIICNLTPPETKLAQQIICNLTPLEQNLHSR